VAGDFTRNGIGVENPTPLSHPLHDTTRQGHAFALLEDIIDADSKVSAILGYFQGSFQIPDNPGQAPVYPYGSRTSFDSAHLNEHQLESNDYAVLSYLHAGERYDFQISAFERYSRLAYAPDAIGDLMFYGLTQTALRQDIAEGVQADATYRLASDHTARFGLLLTAERALTSTGSEVFPCLAADCSSVATTPLSIADSAGKTGLTYSAYLQDEWSLASGLTLNYGLRYDILNGYTNTDQLSPRVNMVWKPESDTAFHAGYSRYFTPPALELISGKSIAKFANSTGYPAGYLPSSPPLDSPILPERSNYYDVGADHVFLPGLKLGIDGYIKIAKDLIDEGQFGAPIILSAFNYGHANVFGAEFTASYEHGDWSIYDNFSFGRQRGTQIVSQQFNFTPPQLAFIADNYIYTDHSQWISVSGGASYNWQGTRLNADVIYGTGLRQSVNGIPNGSTVAPYAQINLGASRRFEDVLGQPIELGVTLINLTDRDYILRSGSGVGVFAPQYGPRRAVYGSVRWFF
jgi:outer membrane receptor protein involved in Fe transport